MSNETEVQGGSPNLAEVVKYIAEREDNLSKYSDKLRQNVEAIFNIFGNKHYCQVCGKENNPTGYYYEGAVCPVHGRFFHEYDFKKEKVMNREIKCFICGHVGKVEGEFRLDIPCRWSDNEY